MGLGYGTFDKKDRVLPGRYVKFLRRRPSVQTEPGIPPVEPPDPPDPDGNMLLTEDGYVLTTENGLTLITEQ